MKAKTKNTCKDCCWYEKLDSRHGVCFRYPPQNLVGMQEGRVSVAHREPQQQMVFQPYFPRTNPDWFCGEFFRDPKGGDA